jgi:hypothetical protein
LRRKQSDSTILAQGLLSLPLYSARNETAGTYQMPLINPIAAYPSDPFCTTIYGYYNV